MFLVQHLFMSLGLHQTQMDKMVKSVVIKFHIFLQKTCMRKVQLHPPLSINITLLTMQESTQITALLCWHLQ